MFHYHHACSDLPCLHLWHDDRFIVSCDVMKLLGRHELTPGITAHEYWRRRHALSELMAPGSIAILPAASLNYMAGIIPYPYRPDADLMYITGVMQPGVVAVLQAGVGGQESTAGDINIMDSV